MDYAVINGYVIKSFESKDDFLAKIVGAKKILIAMNAEKILGNNQRLKSIVGRNIGYSDGIGAVMALRRKGVRAVKIAGAEFWLDIVRRHNGEKSFYLVGASTAVIEETVAKLKVDFPGIDIKGYRNGYLESVDIGHLIDDLVLTRPDIVFVAQGSPRQEFLMDELLTAFPALYMGLGGSFDVYCGLKKRAPKVFQVLGLEWFYRLIKEPTRIGRQVVYARFMALLLLNRL